MSKRWQCVETTGLFIPCLLTVFQTHFGRGLIETVGFFEGGGGVLFHLAKTMVSVLHEKGL